MSVASAPRTIIAYRRHDTARLVGRMTREEFLRFEQTTPEKHQYIEGEAVLMPGSSPEHNLIQADLQFEIELALRGANSACGVIGSDQKIYINDRTILYPDIAVFCGSPQFDHFNALRNPTVVVEVLSPSTEKEDRTDKFTDYQKIASLQHYILVEQERVLVTHYAKTADGVWAIIGTYSDRAETLTLNLSDVSIGVPVSAIYRRVVFTDL